MGAQATEDPGTGLSAQGVTPEQVSLLLAGSRFGKNRWGNHGRLGAFVGSPQSQADQRVPAFLRLQETFLP